MQRQSLFACLLNRVFIRLLKLLESPKFTILCGQIFIRIPITIFKRLDATIFLESYSRILKRRVHFIREIHILSGSRFKIRKLLMLVRYRLLDHIITITQLTLILIILLRRGVIRVFTSFAAHHCDLHLRHQAYELICPTLLGLNLAHIHLVVHFDHLVLLVQASLSISSL
jgi:hypothetical protein